MDNINIKFDLIRKQFPALKQKVRGKELIYLDSAATSLKPDVVVQRVTEFYKNEAANVHRGAHFLSDQATSHFEESRIAIQNFIGAALSEEIIFTKGTTESINLVASTWGEKFIKEKDVILITEMEHHANIVPWQILAEKNSALLKFIPVLDDGTLDLTVFENILKNSPPKIVSISACSNTLGTMNDLKFIIAEAHKVGAIVVVDGAQIVSQKKINVQEIDADFFAFSAHKMFAPFGFGALYGKKALLEAMPPYQYGGSMISEVKMNKSTFNQLPFKFEAGTPHVEGAIGTLEAIRFMNNIGLEDIHAWDQELLKYGTDKLSLVPGLRIFGTAPEKGAVISFMIDKIHSFDLGQLLDQQGIAVRVGHHCTQPLMQRFGIAGTVRASFSIYNNKQDIDKLFNGLMKAREILL